MNTKQLRQKILDLAIKGKLVPQDPNDEPASKLLERIREEKEQLIKEGKLKRDKNESYIFVGDDKLHYEKFADGSVVCIEDEIPFEIPESWAWCRLKDIANYGRMPSLTYKQIQDKNLWILDLEDIEKETSKLIVRNRINNKIFSSSKKKFVKNDVLYGKRRSYLDKVLVADEDGICTTEIVPIRIYKDILPEYLRYILKSPFFLNYVNNLTYGVKMPRLGTDDAENALLPIPPLSDQKKIVNILNSTINAIENITLDKEALSNVIKQTKAKVLDLAIKGKLVPQDPNDEPADKLLEKIREEKEKLIKEGKLKRDKNETLIFKNSDDNSYYEQIDGETVCIDDDLPFEIPNSWRWCRFNNFSLYSTDYVANGSFASLNENVNIYKTPNYALLIKTQDFANNFTKDLTYIDKQSYEFLQKSKLFGGELMLSNIGASIGKAFIIPNLQRPMSIAPNSIIIKFLDNITTKYVYFLILSHFGQSILKGFTAGTAMPKFNKTQLRETLLPYPSYDEQKRIVYKIENIFTYLDNLESIIKGS